MRHANPFLLLVLLGPVVAVHWGWLPALLATLLALAMGYAIRRVFARSHAPTQPGPALLVAQAVGLIPLAAVAALILGNTVVGHFTSVKEFRGPVSPWMFPVGAIILAAILSIVSERVVARPLARLAALLTIVVLIACAIGLPLAAFRGVEQPVFDESGVQTGTERFTLELAAPLVAWKPQGVPPMLPSILLVVTSGALIALPWSHRHGASFVGSPRRATLFEACVAALALTACSAGISMGAEREVRDMGNTGTNPPDRSSISGSLFLFHDTDGTYAILSEYRSQDVSKTGWYGPIHPLAEHRIALYHSDTPGLSAGWGTTPTEEYLLAAIAVRQRKADPSTLDRFTTLNSQVGHLSLMSRENDQHLGVKSFILADYENDAIRQTLRLPSGTVRFDRTGRIATLTGTLPHQNLFDRFGSAESLRSMVDAFVFGGGNLLRSIGVPKSIALGALASLVIVLAFLLLEFTIRAQRSAIRALACVFVPSTTGPACASCDYDMRGLPEAGTARCPECGETERFYTEHDRIALPETASPFNPARWIAWPPVAMTLALLPLPFVVLIPGWGWTMQYARWQTKLTLPDIALWFPMIAAVNLALAAGLLLAARATRSRVVAGFGWCWALLTLGSLIWLASLDDIDKYFPRTVGSMIAPTVLSGLVGIGALTLGIYFRNPTARSPNNSPNP